MLREFESPGFIRAVIYVSVMVVAVVFALGALDSPSHAWSEFVRFVR